MGLRPRQPRVAGEWERFWPVAARGRAATGRVADRFRNDDAVGLRLRAGLDPDRTIPEELGPYFSMALLGFALFLLAWFWSLASGLQILHDARKTKT